MPRSFFTRARSAAASDAFGSSSSTRSRSFAAANGTPMKEWIALDHGTPESDLGLAEEALAFVRSLRR